nr:MAG TPA: Fibritin C-terminal region [Caudoviricetes sp.]
MRNEIVQVDIEKVRRETATGGNTCQRIASILTQLNDSKLENNEVTEKLNEKADLTDLNLKADLTAGNLTPENIQAWNTKLKTLPDAPSDNKQYARKNGAWEEVVATGGGGGNVTLPDNIATIDKNGEVGNAYAKATETITNTDADYKYVVITNDAGGTKKMQVNGLGSNVANSSLTSVNGAGLTLGANWFIDTAGFYYSIKGLSDKSADDSFDRFLVQDADGKVEQFLLNKLFSKAYDIEDKVNDKAFNGYLMYNPKTKQVGFSGGAKVVTTFNVPATINVNVKNVLANINAVAPANNQYSQDIKNTIAKIKQLEDIGFTPVPASDLVLRTLDRSRFPQALITKNYQLPTPFTLSDGTIAGIRSNAFPAEFRNNAYMASHEGEGLYSVGVNKELPTDRNWVFKFRIYNSPQVFRVDRSFGAIHFSDTLDASPRSDLANDLIIKDAWSRETVVTNNRVSSQTVINETDGFADVYLIKEGGLITLFTIMRNTGTMHMTTFTAQNIDKYIHFVTLFSSLSIADFVIKDISYNIQ